MKWRSPLVLKIAIFIIGIPVLGLCVFLVPKVAMDLYHIAENNIEVLIIAVIAIIFYLSTVPFYIALYQAIILLNYIEKNQAFSQKSIKSLKIIRDSAFVFGLLYAIGLPFFYFATDWFNEIGFIFIALILTAASLLISIFMAVLKKLLQQAFDLKSENDLTI